MTKRNIISLVALPIVLVAAYGIERWMDALREASARTFTFNPWLLTLGVVTYTLVVAGMLWWVIAASRPHPVVSSVYILTGSLLTLYVPLRLTVGSRVLRGFFSAPGLAAGQATTQIGAFILMAGIFSLPGFHQT